MIDPHRARKANIAIPSEAHFRTMIKGRISAAARMCAIGMIQYNITSGAVYAF